MEIIFEKIYVPQAVYDEVAISDKPQGVKLKELREFSLHYNALGKKIIELERKNNKQFKEVFKILDGLVEETRNVDEKVMGFLK